jgi:peroxiredoxin-like protein
VKDFPHQYAVTAIGTSESDIDLSAPRLPTFRSAPPTEFDGPGDQWSPETLLVGAVADCFVLTFRAVARASRLPWTSLICQANGTLDRVERVAQFTHIRLHAHLTVPAGTSSGQAQRALERAEHNCLVSNSLKATVVLKADVSEEEAVLC